MIFYVTIVFCIDAALYRVVLVEIAQDNILIRQKLGNSLLKFGYLSRLAACGQYWIIDSVDREPANNINLEINASKIGIVVGNMS